MRALALAVATLVVLAQSPSWYAHAQCGPNPIVCENLQAGNPASEWNVAGAGDATLQGFATDISANRGDTVNFKVSTTASTFSINIYRLGYYGGNGARKVASIATVAGVNQPPCLTVAATQLLDCGNWSISASWAVPTTAVSGIYIAKLTRSDTGGSSHIVFVVRNDSSTSDILFQTSDTTWQAYNQYGGASLYLGNPAAASKVSYNRPFATRGQSGGYGPSDWVFYAEYPTLRWLEANGYDVSYTTGVDSDRRGALIKNHKIFMSVGHDEYWSGGQRANVEAARGAGVSLAFLSGNESFWKTRWENSIDGTGTTYRTLVTYKETQANRVIDPADPPTWTGTWRDPRFSPPADGGNPENALSGQMSTVNRGSAAITVPQSAGALRFWRNTQAASLAPGNVLTLATNTLGYEWDEDLDNGSRPPGLIRMSSTVVSSTQHLVDFGNTYVSGTAATHALTLYRHASGALVFGAGSVQWVWGLDPNHDSGPDTGSTTADVNIQQATLNVLADMGAQPATRQSGLSPAIASTDTYAPTSSIVSPAHGASIPASAPVVISGTASDTGGVVAAVEVSTDGGATWHPAIGQTNWTYTWVPAVLGPATIKSRAVDDSGNIESSSNSVAVTVVAGTCPCTIWPSSTVPWQVDSNDGNPNELGVKFTPAVDGTITGVRFYKAPLNTGTHVGNLWTSSGQLLASVVFTSESGSGWQQATFTTPVAVSAGVQYVASYHTSTGHYSFSSFYFGRGGVQQWPLYAFGSSESGGNGVFSIGASAFPSQTYQAGNYWVDVLFMPTAPDTTPPTVTTVTPPANATNVGTSSTITASFSEPLTASSISSSTFMLRDNTNTIVAASVTYNLGTSVATLTPTQLLAANTTYTASLVGGSGGIEDLAGNPLAATVAWSFTTSASGGCPCSVWPASATPAVAAANDSNAVELGMRFRADTTGTVNGVRFYKGTTNTGTHTGSLWTDTGTLLATVTFSGETASGWQQANFATPVSIAANTTYVISYHSNVGNYAYSSAYFASAGVDNPPLHALASGVDGMDGVYVYGASAFPSQSYNNTNYWVDLVFVPGAPITASVPNVVGLTQASATTAITNAGLAVGSITTASSTTVPAGNVISENPAAGTVVTLGTAVNLVVSSGPPSGGSAVTIWPASAQPSRIATGDSQAVELGVRFSSDVGGTITGVRFYKGATNTGVHTGSLWSNTGTLLATATFVNETASGWQQVSFSSPVSINANTTYVASYHTTDGNYGIDSNYFSNSVDAPPLHALPNSSGGNGLFLYGAGGFPTQSWAASNYWVDVVFVAGTTSMLTVPNVVNLTQAAATVAITGAGLSVGAITTASSATVPAGSVISQNPAAGASVAAGSGVALVVSSGPPTSSCPCSIWPASAQPSRIQTSDSQAVELGVRFTSDVSGKVTGVRFYKGATNTGTHTGSLWSSTGTLLATATFANETGSGWQQVSFSTPVAITAGTTYVVSYHTQVGNYGIDSFYFTNSVDAPPLHALSNSAGGNGVFLYGAGGFPTQSWSASNYWVDVVFVPGP